MMLVVVTLAAMVMEGAYMDWSAIFMTKVFSSGPFLAAMAVALGAGAQAVTRFFVDGFVERYSPTLVARVLLIHEFRRAVLRDPGLPAALLPADWPGAAARQLAGLLYRKLAANSERYLDTNGHDENGPLPAAEPGFRARFAPK